MTAALHLLRPLPTPHRVSVVDDGRAEAERRQALADAERSAIAHGLLAARARRLIPNCTAVEARELERLIAAGPRQGLRDAVIHLELAGVVPVPEAVCA